jgi:hypothetical protein
LLASLLPRRRCLLKLLTLLRTCEQGLKSKFDCVTSYSY